MAKPLSAGGLTVSKIASSLAARRASLASLAVAALAAASPALPARGITPAEMAPHRQTVSDVDAVGGAVLAWLSDQLGLGRRAARGAGTVEVGDYPQVTAAELAAVLVPTYLAAVPELDGWGNPYDYRFDPTDPLAEQVALIRSAGADGSFEGSSYQVGDTATLAEDLVWADGHSVRRPGRELIDLRQRRVRAESEVRGTGIAVLNWLTDQLGLIPPPVAGDGATDLLLFTPIAHADLEALLVPVYLRTLPAVDPWGFAYDYWLDEAHLLEPELVAIRSRGRDGSAEGTTYLPGTFAATAFDRDTVWAEGVLVQGPADLAELVFADGFEAGDLRFWSALAP